MGLLEENPDLLAKMVAFVRGAAKYADWDNPMKPLDLVAGDFNEAADMIKEFDALALSKGSDT